MWEKKVSAPYGYDNLHYMYNSYPWHGTCSTTTTTHCGTDADCPPGETCWAGYESPQEIFQ